MNGKPNKQCLPTGRSVRHSAFRGYWDSLGAVEKGNRTKQFGRKTPRGQLGAVTYCPTIAQRVRHSPSSTPWGSQRGAAGNTGALEDLARMVGKIIRGLFDGKKEENSQKIVDQYNKRINDEFDKCRAIAPDLNSAYTDLNTITNSITRKK